MSIQRQMKRAAIRKLPVEERPEARDPATKLHGKTAYSVCHPTKGWRRFSVKRMMAQHAMAGALA